MKTNIRTYHPVPALQRTSGSLHDGPRIKHLLQASVFGMLPIDLPRTPEAILARLVSRIFVFGNTALRCLDRDRSLAPQPAPHTSYRY